MTSTGVLTLSQAYAVCRAIAKREAKNFYYSFRALPVHKRDAMCAVYAFMRQADDIADDESLAVAERREAMGDWLYRWRAFRSAGQGRRSRDAVFVALGDTQRRFGVPDSLLEELVQGTNMDLEETGMGVEVGAGLRGYRTYEDLCRYCYLVASVVGLVCIRIFGYSDPRAEALAEKTGIAFQLTNILRDVKEDAERGRLYLPMDMMAEYSVTPEDVLALAGGRALRPNERGLVHAISARAWDNYAEAGRLLPLIDRDSRPALWVLVTIYSGLLARVDARNGDVFSERVRVPTAVKMGILLRGLAGAVVSWVRR